MFHPRNWEIFSSMEIPLWDDAVIVEKNQEFLSSQAACLGFGGLAWHIAHFRNQRLLVQDNGSERVLYSPVSRSLMEDLC